MAEIIFPNLGITFESLDPVAFRVAGFSIYWYAIFVVLGIIAGYYFGAHFMPKRTGQSPKNYTDFGVWVIPSAILGGRLFYLAFTPWPPDAGFFYIFNLRDGGIAIWGVLITSIVVCAIYARARKIPFFHFTDTGIVGFIIGHVIGRFGNFTNREAFGGYAPNNAPFAMQLRLGTIRGPVTQETIDNIVTRGGAQYYQVHPTFLYEAAINLALFIFLVIYSKKKKFNGEIVAIYFLVYGITRFFLETMRTDNLMIGDTNIAIAHVLSGAAFLFGLGFLVCGHINYSKKAGRPAKKA